MKTDKTGNPLQVDGINDSSDDDEDESLNEDDIEEENDENDIEKQIYEKDNENGSKSDGPVLIEKPLNSEDDDDDDSTSEHSDSENIITCQYEKVSLFSRSNVFLEIDNVLHTGYAKSQQMEIQFEGRNYEHQWPQLRVS